MNVIETALPGVLVLEPRIFGDERGIFFETFNLTRMIALGLPADWRQDNVSVSKANVIRGIHYQVGQAQGKLVRVASGSVLDVVVDLRRSSPTFGQHVSVELSGENHRMIWIPIGFGHGFSVLSAPAVLSYKVTDYYSPTSERCVLWNDPALGIDWRIKPEDAIVSAKDRAGLPFRQAEVFE